MFSELAKPDILDTLTSVRKSIYKDPLDRIQESIHNRLESELGSDKNIVNQYKKIQEFATRFSVELSREPTRKEYLDNLEGISEQLIDTYLEQL
jgi:hypothetical protein